MLFMGVAMSITAFPVLARILNDRGMHRTSVGVIALAAAAIDDVLAWTLLAFVYAVASGNSPLAVLRIVALTAVFAAVMFLVVKPLLARIPNWYKTSGRITPDIFAVVLVGILLSALATERIGIHEIFGAFVFGAIMPREGAQEFTREILGAARADQRFAAAADLLRHRRIRRGPDPVQGRESDLAASAHPGRRHRRKVRRSVRRRPIAADAGAAECGGRGADEHPRVDRVGDPA